MGQEHGPQPFRSGRSRDEFHHADFNIAVEGEEVVGLGGKIGIVLGDARPGERGASICTERQNAAGSAMRAG